MIKKRSFSEATWRDAFSLELQDGVAAHLPAEGFPQEVAKTFDLPVFPGLRQEVFHFSAVCAMVVKLLCQKRVLFLIDPLNIPKMLRSECVPHDISFATVSFAGQGSWKLADDCRFDLLFGIRDQGKQAGTLQSRGTGKTANIGKCGVQIQQFHKR